MRSHQLLHLRELDLNGLVHLAALLRSASVTEAAQATQTSRPVMSKVLQKMRTAFDDALLVREGNRMMLTPKALELLPLVDAALERIEQVYVAPGPFDPSAASRRIRIAANDHLQGVLAPSLHALLRAQAPRVVLEFGPVGMLQPQHLLSQGVVDLIIGLTQDVSDLRTCLLYQDAFVCVACATRQDLPQVLDLATFSAQAHLDVSPSGLGMLRASLDRSIQALGGQRHVMASISKYSAVPAMLSGSDMLALIPRRALDSTPGGVLRELPLGFTLAPFSVSMWWHNTTHNDPLARWLRGQVVRLSAEI